MRVAFTLGRGRGLERERERRLERGVVGSSTTTDRDRTSVRRMTVVWRPERRRTDTTLPGELNPCAGAGTAADAGAGCASRLGPRRGQLHRPPGAARREDRERTCTTALRHEHASRIELLAQSRLARRSARSSRQTVAALGPTSLEDGAATACTHPGAEPMLFGPLQIVWLVGALQRKPPRQAAPRLQKSEGTGTARQAGGARTVQGYGHARELGNQRRNY